MFVSPSNLNDLFITHCLAVRPGGEGLFFDLPTRPSTQLMAAVHIPSIAGVTPLLAGFNQIRQMRRVAVQVHECRTNINYDNHTFSQQINLERNIQTFNAFCEQYNQQIENHRFWNIVNCVVYFITCRRVQLKVLPVAELLFNLDWLVPEYHYDYSNFTEVVSTLGGDLPIVSRARRLTYNLLQHATTLIINSEPQQKTQLLVIANEECRVTALEGLPKYNAVNKFWANKPDIVMNLYAHLLTLTQLEQLEPVRQQLHEAFLKIEINRLDFKAASQYLALFVALGKPPARPEWHSEFSISSNIEILRFLKANSARLEDMRKSDPTLQDRLFLRACKAETGKDIGDLLQYLSDVTPDVIKEHSEAIQTFLVNAVKNAQAIVNAFWARKPDIAMNIYAHLLTLPKQEHLEPLRKNLHETFLKIEINWLNFKTASQYLSLAVALSKPTANPEWHHGLSVSNSIRILRFLRENFTRLEDVRKSDPTLHDRLFLRACKAEKDIDIEDLLQYLTELPQGVIKEHSDSIQAFLATALVKADAISLDGQSTFLQYLWNLKSIGFPLDFLIKNCRLPLLKIFSGLRNADLGVILDAVREFELYVFERLCADVPEFTAQDNEYFYPLLLSMQAERKELFLMRAAPPVSNARGVLFNFMEYLGKHPKMREEEILKRGSPLFFWSQRIVDVTDPARKEGNMSQDEMTKLLILADKIARLFCPEPKQYGRLTALLGAPRIPTLIQYLADEPNFVPKVNAIATHLLFSVIVGEVKIRDAKESERFMESARLLLQNLDVYRLSSHEFAWLKDKPFFKQFPDRFLGQASEAQLTALYGPAEADYPIDYSHIRATIGTEAPIPELPEGARGMDLNALVELFNRVKSAADKDDDVKEIHSQLTLLAERVKDKKVLYTPTNPEEREKWYRKVNLQLRHGILACQAKSPAEAFNYLKTLSESGHLCYGGVKPAVKDFYSVTTGALQTVEADSVKGGLLQLLSVYREGIFKKQVRIINAEFVALENAAGAAIEPHVDVHDLETAMHFVGRRFAVKDWEDYTAVDPAKGRRYFEPELVQRRLLLACLRDCNPHDMINFCMKSIEGIGGSAKIVSGELSMAIRDWFKDNMPNGKKDPNAFQCEVLQLDPVMYTGVGRIKREWMIYFLMRNGILQPKRGLWARMRGTKLSDDQLIALSSPVH